METEKSFPVHFQYGYGDFYGMPLSNLRYKGDNVQFWQWCRDNKVIARYDIHRGCKNATW